MEHARGLVPHPMGEGWVPGFAGRRLIPGEKPWAQPLAWFGPRLCRKGRYATLRAWAQTTNIGCQALVFLMGWVLAGKLSASPAPGLRPGGRRKLHGCRGGASPHVSGAASRHH